MSTKIQQQPNRAAFDVQGAQDLRQKFQKDPKAGLQEAARQFENLFLQMVLKSMRDTVPTDGLMQSDQTRFYNSLLDQQMAQNLAGSANGVGFARLIEQQMAGFFPQSAAESAEGDSAATANLAGHSLPSMLQQAQQLRHYQVPSSLPTSAAYGVQAPVARGDADSRAVVSGSAQSFASAVWPHALEASRVTGIPPQFLVAQSALESGWGRSEIRHPDGRSSHNLFGIKAGKNWTGETVDAVTTEYVNGEAMQVTERFRAYPSYAEAFRDYANLLRNNPRYSGVIGSQDGMEFARRLQQAGYATDPMYADKLSRIINGPTLRQALIG